MGRIRKAYTAKEKLTIIKYAEEHGNRCAGRQFDVSEASVREWRCKKSQLETMPKKKMADRGSKPHYPQIEETLLSWVRDRRLQGIAVSTTELRLMSLYFAKQHGVTSFGCSVDWVYSFMRRNALSIRRRTHIAQKLPSDHEDQLLKFQTFIIKLRKQHDFELSQIGNADQTPFTFDMPYERTVALKGSNSVSINTTGNEKNRFTIMLACTADGGKLPPYIIFKQKTLPKVTWPEGVNVRCQEKGWMDDNLVKDWLRMVWGRRPGALAKKSLLVLDAFRCHKTDMVKKELRQMKSSLAVIPGGMTSMLQPLDVSINKPMKTLLRKRWNDWYSDGAHTFTAGGKMRKPELQEISKWVADAWLEIDPAIIVRSFKKCCISNNMVGTEDDIIWEDNVRTSHQTDITEEEDDDHSYYTVANNGMTDEAIQKLFDESDDEEFDGFDPVRE